MIDFTKYFQDYFDPSYPVCREERQYAFFLCSKLMELIGIPTTADQDILTACGIGTHKQIVTLKSVLYEPSFLRDIFFRERKEHPQTLYFNRLLYQFVSNKTDCTGIPTNKNLGGKSGIVDLKKRECPEDQKTAEEDLNMKWMMNVKPDIAVIYEASEKNHLKFIECKYFSKEDTYAGGIKQRKIQQKVSDFLCKHTGMESDPVQLVVFRSEGNKNLSFGKEHVQEIEVQNLIPDTLKHGLLLQ